MMDKQDMLMAYCGLQCETCPLHLATREQDKALQHSMRESIANQCANLYGMTLKAEDITDCDGCRANTGRIFKGCEKCEIRKCARQKNIESCAFCDDYTCDFLEKHFAQDPDSRKRLEAMRGRSKL